MMHYLKCWLWTLVFSAGITNLSVGQFAKTTGLLQEYFSIQHKRLGFNGVALVSKKGNLLYQQAIGKASFELDVPVTTHTVFRVASISKQFTAFLVVLAEQEGKLQFADRLSAYFPELKDSAWRNITLQQLLTHTAGLPHNEGIGQYWQLKSYLPLTQQQALEEVFKMQLLYPPGTDAKYSSPGYLLLACILEKIYNQPFSSLLAEKITGPLQIHSTGVCGTGKIIPGMATPYHLMHDSLLMAPYRDFALMKGSGNMYASAKDLLKWNENFLSGGKWTNTLLNQLNTIPIQKKLDAIGYYGYGRFIRLAAGGKRKAWYHGGGMYGCSGIAVVYPDEELVIVILSNVSFLPVQELWGDVEKILFNEPFEMPPMHETIVLQKEQLQQLKGKYRANGQLMHVLYQNNQLYVKLGNNPPFEIYAEKPYRFYGKKVNVTFTFKQDAEGKVVGVEAEGREQVHYFTRQ